MSVHPVSGCSSSNEAEHSSLWESQHLVNNQLLSFEQQLQIDAKYGMISMQLSKLYDLQHPVMFHLLQLLW